MRPRVLGQGTHEKQRHYCKKRTNYLLHVASPLAYATQALKSRCKTFQPLYCSPRPRPPPCSGQPWPGPILFSYLPEGPRPTGPW
jgi:hypothetical protein